MPVGPVADAVMFAGVPVIVGPVVSDTLTVNVDVDALLCASVAVHVTVVVVIANVLPDAGTQLTATVPSTASVAVGFV